jgi:rubrerythrin
MNVLNLFTDLERVDPEVYGRFDSRRRVFRHFGTAGKVVAGAALPGLLSGFFQKAYGQTGLSGDIIAALNLALSLEYLEYYYYQAGLNANIFSAANKAAFTTILQDELGHITALRAILGSAAIADPTPTAFDFTAGKQVAPAPTASLAPFLALAQAFEDLGVRAYKGSLATLLPNKEVLKLALGIHSVEARHASHIRTLRRGGVGVAGADGGGPNDSLPKSWVSLLENNGPIPALTTAIYSAGTTVNSPAEDNLVQLKLNVQTNSDASLALTATTASEAFDEPLDAARVKTIALSFVAAGNPKNLFM